MTNWIIGHTDRFKAAVSQRSISSWITDETLVDIGIWYSVKNIGCSVYENFEKVWWHSPLKYACNFKPLRFLFTQTKITGAVWKRVFLCLQHLKCMNAN